MSWCSTRTVRRFPARRGRPRTAGCRPTWPPAPGRARSRCSTTPGSARRRTATTPSVAPFWDRLAADGAELILNGHEHSYERFDPQTPAAAPSNVGLRELVVGTGGVGFYDFPPPSPIARCGSPTSSATSACSCRPPGTAGSSWRSMAPCSTREPEPVSLTARPDGAAWSAGQRRRGVPPMCKPTAREAGRPGRIAVGGGTNTR